MASLNIEENTNLAAFVLDKFHQFLLVFTKQIAEALTAYRYFDHIIDLKKDEKLP
jgi:hypothetical protein